jgi:hypothetical protein
VTTDAHFSRNEVLIVNNRISLLDVALIHCNYEAASGLVLLKNMPMMPFGLID